MDLVNVLASQLGVDPNQAQAVAGAVLGQVQQQVGSEDAEGAEALASAVPELGGWQEQAASMLGASSGGGDGFGGMVANLTGGGEGGGGGMLSGLAAAAGSGMGNDLVEAFAGKEAAQQAQVVGLVGKLGIGPEKAALVVPTVLDFLRERMGDDMLEKVLQYAPMLAGAAGGDSGGAAGGLGSMMSGLLGGND